MYKIGDKILVELEVTTIIEDKNGRQYVAKIISLDKSYYTRDIKVYENEIIKKGV